LVLGVSGDANQSLSAVEVFHSLGTLSFFAVRVHTGPDSSVTFFIFRIPQVFGDNWSALCRPFGRHSALTYQQEEPECRDFITFFFETKVDAPLEVSKRFLHS
jgi:hypothetical protein